MEFSIRSYHPSDLVDLYRICLCTGDNGAGASQLYRDPDLLGHYYVAPYAVHEPELCLVLAHRGKPCGYILGTRDSAAFSGWAERAWFPVLRRRYALPAPHDASRDAQIVRAIHAGYRVDDNLSAYPAHLHIDLLPLAQGQGWGSKLMNEFLARLRALNAPGVHLGVDEQNIRAIRFYERIGFHQIAGAKYAVTFGMRLAQN